MKSDLHNIRRWNFNPLQTLGSDVGGGRFWTIDLRRPSSMRVYRFAEHFHTYREELENFNHKIKILMSALGANEAYVNKLGTAVKAVRFPRDIQVHRATVDGREVVRSDDLFWICMDEDVVHWTNDEVRTNLFRHGKGTGEGLVKSGEGRFYPNPDKVSPAVRKFWNKCKRPEAYNENSVNVRLAGGDPTYRKTLFHVLNAGVSFKVSLEEIEDGRIIIWDSSTEEDILKSYLIANPKVKGRSILLRLGHNPEEFQGLSPEQKSNKLGWNGKFSIGKWLVEEFGL